MCNGDCRNCPNREEDSPSRRRFLGGLVAAINGVVLLAIAGPVSALVGAPLAGRSRAKWIAILDANDLPETCTREVTYTTAVRDGYQVVDRSYSVFLRRRGSDIAAIDPSCTHLGCRVKYQEDQDRFLCPCHGGVFDGEGAVISGPPPSALVRHDVKLEDGKIWVRKAGTA